MAPKEPAAQEPIPPTAPVETPGKHVLFHVEVPYAAGLPRAERTQMRLAGFVIESSRLSEPLEEETAEPSGWKFMSAEAMRLHEERARAAEEAAKAPQGKDKKKAQAKGDTAVQEELPPEADPLCQIKQPFGSDQENRKLLDGLCTPLRVVMERAESQKVLGTATVQLKDLIHDASVVEVDADLEWSQEFLDELREKQEQEYASAQESGEEQQPQEGEAEDPREPVEPFVFEPPPRGKVHVRTSLAGPIGRTVCPEDLNDWTVLTVNIEGCFNPPGKLVEAGGPLPQSAVGVIAEHPLNYSLHVLGCEFNSGQLVVPDRKSVV